MLENVSSMNEKDRRAITQRVDKVYESNLYDFDAAEVSPIRRPRLYWSSWMLCQYGPLHVQQTWGRDCERMYEDVSNPSSERHPLELFL
eukprot:11355830-Karenia_brevis.AAC.1